MSRPDVLREGSLVTLVVDGHPQSAVDLDDPLRLDFEYVRHLAMAIDTLAPAGRLRVVHVGGAGLTLPRWLAATRPGSSQVVLEPDAALTAFVRRELPLPRGHRIRVRAIDGRTGLAALREHSADVVVVDAYAAGRVPGGLVTTEAAAEVARVLGPAGIVLANLADEPGLRWIARVAASLDPHLGPPLLVGLHEVLKGRRFGNVVLAAGTRPLQVAALRRAAAAQPLPTGVLTAGELDRRVPGARAFRDDETEPSPVPPTLGSWRRR